MVSKSSDGSRRQSGFAARLAAGTLTDAERGDMVRQLRDALLEAGRMVRGAHGGAGGAERRCCREGTCEESRGLAAWRAGGRGGNGQTARQYISHVRLTRDGAEVVDSAFQRAADDVEAALPAGLRQAYRDVRRMNGRIG